MKKNGVIIFIFVCSVIYINAQMSRWIMHPSYDKIYLASGAPLLICDSLETSYIWDFNGNRLNSTIDNIAPFCEGYSVVTQKGRDNITGIFDSQGKFIELNGYYEVAYNHPYFSDGYLLVKEGNKNCFINKKGEEELFGPFIKMYPFNNGFASCIAYENVEKLKNPYFKYITKDKQQIKFSYNDKTFDYKDVDFLSSVNDEGIGVAIIKNKVYLFDKESCNIEPVYANRKNPNLKKQVSVTGELHEFIIDMNDSIIILGKGDKKERMRFHFDRFLRPTKIKYVDGFVYYKENQVDEVIYTSPFTPLKVAESKLGLRYNDEKILPPQFDEVGLCVNDFVAVKIGNKWGMVTYDPSLKYKLIMHDGKDIAFRHKEVVTNIKLELPPIISADKCRYDIAVGNGCDLDKISLETKNTENGNYVQYKCVLTIPDSLPDKITEIQYPVQIVYDGLKYPIVPIKINAWHYKYININLDESETILDGSDVTFTINVLADKQPGENDYPFEIRIDADTLQYDITKISETRYKCKLFQLAEGVNNVNINIIENGCPPSVFPFEITYIKPVVNKRSKKQSDGAVKIEKKNEVRKDSKQSKANSGLILPI